MRSCIFCGRSPVTVEDVWPLWLVKRFPRKRIRVWRAGPKPLEFFPDKIETRAKVVCATCNNGWMSNLETAAAPVLGPLVDGEHRVLDVQQQSIAAAWGIKTTMVFEHTLSDPSAVYWNDDERKQFARTAQVPQETVVTIAGYAGISLAYSIGGARQLTGIASDEPLAKGFRGTLVVGHLVLQVEADRWQATTGRMGLWWPPKHADQSEWIFPSQHAQVQFPPGRMLNDAEIHAFGD